MITAPTPAAAPSGRRAFVIGNVGKLGAEVLNALLASPEYGGVQVAVRQPMRIHVPKLEAVAAADGDWAPAAGARAPEDAFLCIEPPARSFWKIDKPFVAIDSARAARLAGRLRAAGTRRVAVITPLEALMQMGAVPLIWDADELSILNAGFERVLVLRPVQEAASGAQARGFFAALGGMVLGTLGSYMTPKELQPVRARQAARAAVSLLAQMQDGVQVVGAAKLRALVDESVAPAA